MTQRLDEQRALAARYGALALPDGDILKFTIDNNGHSMIILYTTYSRGKTPWAVAKVTPIPEGERGAGQDQYDDHAYFTDLEDALVYALVYTSGETLNPEE
jgi:hypothetical protein